MATLTGTQIANTYKQLLQVGSGNNGLTASVQNVQDGQGNNSPLQLSQSAVNIDGTFQLNGVTLTANASALNDIADLTGATGIIAVSGGNVYGRTLTGGTGVSITNADGTEGNPTIALNPTGVVSASYGPATNIEINSVGQVVSAGAATSVSVSGVTANTFTGGTFAGTTGDFSSNVSVGGNLVIAGQFSPASLSVTGTINATKISATDATFNNNVSVGGNLVIAGQFSPAALSVTGTVNAANISATDATFNNNVSVGGNLVVTGQLSPAALSVTGTVNATKISATNATFNSVVSAGFFVGDGSGLINVPSVEGGTVKFITAGTGIKLTVDAAVTTTIPVSGTVAVSANQNFGSVSVSTALAVTGSALFGIVSATNIDTDELLIAGVSAATVTEVAAVSALTQTNLDSITSINTVVANVSALTSVNAAAITSINTVVANVSALTSVNAAAITSINGVIEGNVSADSGTFNTLTVVTSASVGGTLNVGGNVGIGTASPAVPLQISSATPSIRLTDTDDNSDAQIGAAAGGLLVFDADINNEVAGSAILFRVDGGSEKMRIDSSGNVGINTTSPLAKLHSSVSSSGAALAGGVNVAAFLEAATNTSLQISTGTGSSAYINLGDAADIDATRLASQPGFTQLSASGASDYLRFDAGGFVERMRIDSSGNVGINTTTTLGAKLFVSQGAAASPATSGNMTTGAVIGSSTAGEALNVGTDANGAWYNAAYANNAGVARIHRWLTGGTERMRITSTGNVGIGTSSPDRLFEVEEASGDAWMRLRASDTGGGADTIFENLVADNSQNNYIYFGDLDDTNIGMIRYSHASNFMSFTTNTAERLRIDSSGNVLIGTTSDTTDLAYSPKLKLSGSGPVLYLEETDTSQDYSITALGSKFYIRDATAVVPRLTIDSSGNVGIGTASPATKFHVADGTSSLRFRQNGTVAETLTIGPSGSDAAVYLGDATDTVRAGLYYDTSENDLQIRGYNNSTRILIDSVGNVGIGTTSPSTKTEISTNNETSILRLTDTATIGAVDRKVGGIEFYQNDASGGAGIGSSIAAHHVNVSGDTDLRFATGDNTECMRIDSSGTLLVGMTASSDTLANTGIELYNSGRLNATRTGNPVLYLNRKTSGGTIVTFRLDGNEEGTISIDSSSGVSYNTTSDYRLKENVTEVTGAANRVKALNPVRFNFIAAPDKIVDGFLAHEVSNIVPEAIHGEKDAIDAEGNPKYQGIDQSKLVPLLTAALQEALTKIDELEARVAALETA